jgi:hypothetical protein
MVLLKPGFPFRLRLESDDREISFCFLSHGSTDPIPNLNLSFTPLTRSRGERGDRAFHASILPHTRREPQADLARFPVNAGKL